MRCHVAHARGHVALLPPSAPQLRSLTDQGWGDRSRRRLQHSIHWHRPLAPPNTAASPISKAQWPRRRMHGSSHHPTTSSFCTHQGALCPDPPPIAPQAALPHDEAHGELQAGLIVHAFHQPYTSRKHPLEPPVRVQLSQQLPGVGGVPGAGAVLFQEPHCTIEAKGLLRRREIDTPRHDATVLPAPPQLPRQVSPPRGHAERHAKARDQLWDRHCCPVYCIPLQRRHPHGLQLVQRRPQPLLIFVADLLFQLRHKHCSQDRGQGEARHLPVLHPRRESAWHRWGRSTPIGIVLLIRGLLQPGKVRKKAGRRSPPLQQFNRPIRPAEALREAGSHAARAGARGIIAQQILRLVVQVILFRVAPLDTAPVEPGSANATGALAPPVVPHKLLKVLAAVGTSTLQGPTESDPQPPTDYAWTGISHIRTALPRLRASHRHTPRTQPALRAMITHTGRQPDSPPVTGRGGPVHYPAQVIAAVVLLHPRQHAPTHCPQGLLMAVRIIRIKALRTRERVGRHQPSSLRNRSMFLVRDTPPVPVGLPPLRLVPAPPDPRAQHLKAMQSLHDLRVVVQVAPSTLMTPTRISAVVTRDPRSIWGCRFQEDRSQVRRQAAIRRGAVHLEGTEEGSLRAGTVVRRAALAP